MQYENKNENFKSYAMLLYLMKHTHTPVCYYLELWKKCLQVHAFFFKVYANKKGNSSSFFYFPVLSFVIES